jgi:hypothetical protein
MRGAYFRTTYHQQEHARQTGPRHIQKLYEIEREVRDLEQDLRHGVR